MSSSNIQRVDWAMRIGVAAILGQTVFFKFTGAPESVYIFETLGAEPWGRIGSGLAELLAVVLILTPWRTAWGSLLAMGVMAGAIGSHVTKLGIVVQDDGGTLFGMAVITFALATAVTGLRWRDVLASSRPNRDARGHSPS